MAGGLSGQSERLEKSSLRGALLERDLSRAAARRDLAGVKEALSQGANPLTRCERGDPLISLAMKTWRSRVSCEPLARALLEAGADPDQENKGGQTSLLTACFVGDEGVARALLEAGADPNASDSSGDAPAHYIGAGGDWEDDSEQAVGEALRLARALFEAGASFRLVNANGQTPMDRARARGQSSLAEAMEALAQSKELAAEASAPKGGRPARLSL